MFKRREDLIKFVDKFEKSELTYLYLEYDNFKLKLDKRQNAPQQESSAVVDVSPAQESEATSIVNGECVTAPLVGIFYANQPGGEPYVTVGSKVKKGQVLCAIEAMKMMNDITAPCDGVIASVLAENGKMVEYGQKLFVISAL